MNKKSQEEFDAFVTREADRIEKARNKLVKEIVGFHRKDCDNPPESRKICERMYIHLIMVAIADELDSRNSK